ncbi:glycerate kinase [Halorubrum sp. CSM-61]|uniref:glycerate kinase type-2 family protein n=1 Tax=Halorubrum sp. CSM-61 TaxID=2485838 RepID=UPI000F4CCD07|nr:DUF4147 domain-containing protein [Halorubrum sp. CSM-61]
MILNRNRVARTDLREVAIRCVESAIDAAHPDAVIEETVAVSDNRLRIDDTKYDLDAFDDVYVVGGGNVAGHVAAALEAKLGSRITDGVVVTDDPVSTDTVDIVEGDYPVPSERCMAGTRRVLDLASTATETDLLVTVLSGGGSPLLSAPVADISLSDLQVLTERLFASGGSDMDINVVRKHLSEVKGGKLARAAMPAQVVTMVFSDVVENDAAAVASGPTLPDESTYADALDILERYDIDPPQRVVNHLERGRSGAIPETPTTGASVFERISCHTIADGTTALAGARKAAREQGFEPVILTSRLRGAAREAAKALVAVGEEITATGEPVEPPAVVLATGQTTAMTAEDDDTGPNQEFALSAAVEFHRSLTSDAALASVGTDGFDGFADTAGAVVDTTTGYPVADAWDALNEHGAPAFLHDRGDCVDISSTGTNVNDIHVLVVDE